MTFTIKLDQHKNLHDGNRTFSYNRFINYYIIISVDNEMIPISNVYLLSETISCHLGIPCYRWWHWQRHTHIHLVLLFYHL